MIRDVNEQASQRGWHFSFTHTSGLFKVLVRERTNPGRGALKSSRKLSQNLRFPRSISIFFSQHYQLLGAQISSLRICQKAIEAARDMPNLKCNRWQPRRTRIQFSLG